MRHRKSFHVIGLRRCDDWGAPSRSTCTLA